MSLIQFLRMLYARRMIVLATFLSCLITAAVTAFILPPRYEARARIMLDVLKPDPVTGQAAGFDQRVRVERVAARQRNLALVNATYEQLASALRILGASPEPATIALLQSTTRGTLPARQRATHEHLA